ncbi:MAG: histidine kinase [Prevotella sp.]|nr:histidine kinase [Prevotella sp.]
MFSIRTSLSRKLSLAITLLAVPIFIISLGLLFTQSRKMIRSEAEGRAAATLNATMQRLYSYITTIQTATNANSWLVTENLQPDSILNLTRAIVAMNSHIDGCSISMEPDFFPSIGRYYSAYTIREEHESFMTDSLTTVVERSYDYFSKVWYRTPRQLNAPCWVEYFDDANTLKVVLNGMIASYGMPIHLDNGNTVAVISTGVSLKRLSEIVSQEKPYPNSYYIMINGEGRYIIHPDSSRLFNETIFSGADMQQHPDIIALGHDMTSGGQGIMSMEIDGVPSIVTYQPVPGTSWSMALVCADSDILHGYHRMTYLLIPLIFFGLLFILLLCRRTVNHATRPLSQLLQKTQEIASGNMEVHIRRSKRQDAVGCLQNSFASMLQRLNFHMGSVRYTSEQARHRNEELANATQMAEEADRQKTIFIQNVTHQIRTPLNIIMGFAQVLGGHTGEEFDDEETKTIAQTMMHNAILLKRLVLMLFDSSETGLSEELKTRRLQTVSCNELANQCIADMTIQNTKAVINFHSEIADDFCINTSRLYMTRSIRELIYNAIKYSDGRNIWLRVVAGEPKESPKTIRFIVEDTGKGIDKADCEKIFKFFTKVDDLSEGLGLGLPLAKRHVQNLGGDLTLDPDYHDGCRFIIELPCK